MNRKVEKRNLGLLPIVLVTVIALFIVISACTNGGNVNGTTDGIKTTGNTLKEVDSLDINSLREQYFNKTNVIDNTVKYDGERWVIVELNGDNLYDTYLAKDYGISFSEYLNTTDGQKAKQKIEVKHEQFLNELSEKNVAYQYKYSYSTVNNGLALKVNAKGYNAINAMSGVKGVYFSESYAVPKVAISNNANVYTTGIYNSADLDYKGEGMVVAVLDTGLDYSHEAFTNMPVNPAWDKEYVAARMAESTRFNAKATADDVYYNAKVPYAYDYADDDPDVYPSYSTHGTHVAGIVGGKSSYVVNKETDEKFIGVAPEAQLVICKVFTDNLDSEGLGGADTIDIIAAVSDCVELGVDVINMSLGSSAGFADEKSDTMINEVYERVKDAGISLVCAASNDYSSGFGGGNGTNLASNPDSGTVGSPSTYDAALSVASINGQLASYITANDDENQVAFITEASDENGNEYDFIDLLYKKVGKPLTENLRFKYVVIGGVGRTTNYTTQAKRELANKDGYDGTIALVKRGDTTFAEKVQNAMDNGADACIIYNNVSATIRMSLGEVDDPIPTCSITMDAGKVFVDNAVRSTGVINVSNSYKAGPFMSDFSSWGPMPDLQLKPEISAHGGEITSAVPGGYDVYSGTSMAAPNMAGAIALLRQYLKEANPSLTGTALNARINQVLMSTATIALNEEGNPYSPRKQGAGLAGIADAINTESYITVMDDNGVAKDKTKIELYDDKQKVGKYELEFVINNVSGKAETYSPKTYVMTETLASDNKTVAEKAYMLNDSTIVYYVNGEQSNGNVTVPASSTVTVKVVITLGNNGRSYIEKSFVNGMYVEGFVSLEATGSTEVTIGLPYLAFYGDWNAAPLFDYSEYELAESQMDTGVPEEDKLKASAAATKVLGLYYDDKYILSLGSYVYEMAEEDVQIYPDTDKSAVSIYDTENQRTIYELYMVYAGLLRGAAYMDIVITEEISGNVVYSERQENISKSYAAGGGNRGAIIMLEIKPQEWNLSNNNSYTVSLKGELDYEGGENPDRNTFDFKFTIDYEAPQILDYRVRYETYTENKKEKYRIFMDVDVFDNQYVMDVMPCYVKYSKGKNVLTLLNEYPIPVYGEKGKASTISFEITDVYEDYVKTGQFYLAVEDYAMNQTSYVVQLDSAIELPESVTIGLDNNKVVDTEEIGKNTDADKTPYNIYEVTIAPNELYKPIVNVTPNTTYKQTLSWYVAEGSEYVIAEKQEIFGLKKGKATLQLCNGTGETKMIYAQLDVTVDGEEISIPDPEKITLMPVENNSYYIVNLDGTDASIELNPNQVIKLRASVTPWYFKDVEFTWTSSNESIVKVDSVGTVTAVTKGTAYVNVTAEGYSRLSKSVRVTVGEDFRVVSYTLYDYYGGEICEIPEDLNIMFLDEDCFKYNTTVKKIVFPSTLTELPKYAFEGCSNLEEIVVPSQCIVIGESAFENCKKLKKITFQKFVDSDKVVHEDYFGAITIGKKAFKNCEKLSEIVNQHRLTTVYDNAFEGCKALESIDITCLRVTGSNVFRNCTALKTVTSGVDTNVGKQMFFGCTALKSFTYYGNNINEGAFNGCTQLSTFEFAGTAPFEGIARYALANTAITAITLPDGNYSIGENAFAGCASLRSVTLSDGAVINFGNSTPFGGCSQFGKFIVNDANANYAVDSGILYNKGETVLVAVPYAKSEINVLPTVTEIANAAFAGIQAVSNLDLTGVEKIGKYAFANSGLVSIILPDVTELPLGVFAGSGKLNSIEGLNNVVKVSAYAFQGCTSLKNISLPEAKYVDTYAFQKSGLTTLSMPKVEYVGDYAFDSTKLTEVELASVKELGERAFANVSTLLIVDLGQVEVMGKNAFFNSNKITTVTLADGASVVGDYAFYSENPRTELVTVNLPDTIERIGEFAFANATNLTSINLSSVTEIADYAFLYTTSLASVDLSSVVTIGTGAFAEAAITSLDLANAKVIDDYAFLDSALNEITLSKVEYLGDFAFTGTQLVTVTLPASYDSREYDYVWNEYDEKGRVSKVRTRKEPTFGIGVFSGISTLTAINVAEGNVDFVSIDGVLYSKVTNGYVLEQYPTAKEGESYTVINNTVKISDSAFEEVKLLEKIEFPYTVKSIGSFAFYNSSVKDYTFNSVQAPALMAAYVDYYTFDEDDIMFSVFCDEILGSTLFYANFYDYVAKRVYSDLFNPEYYVSPSFGLTLTIPKNGKGYDTVVWTNFFETINKTDEILPDDFTHEAIALINSISSVMTIEQINSATSVEELNAVSTAVFNARKAYNKVTTAEQLALAKDAYDVLIAYEKALRDKKAALGSPVALKELQLASIPTKIRYVAGESFDTTGMVIKAIYEDHSEVFITDYTLDKTVLKASDEYVTVSYVDRGTTYTVKVMVNVAENPNAPSEEEPTVQPGDGDVKEDNDNDTVVIIAVCASVGGALLIAAAVVVIVLLKKKKNAVSVKNDDANGNENN